MPAFGAPLRLDGVGAQVDALGEGEPALVVTVVELCEAGQRQDVTVTDSNGTSAKIATGCIVSVSFWNIDSLVRTSLHNENSNYCNLNSSKANIVLEKTLIKTNNYNLYCI